MAIPYCMKPKKKYFFPREDFKIFTKYKLPEDFGHLPRGNGKLNYVDVCQLEKKSFHRLSFDLWGFYGIEDPRPGDLWVTTSMVTGDLVALVYLDMEKFYHGNVDNIPSRDYRATAQNFGPIEYLLDIPGTKERVIAGKMRPVEAKGTVRYR